MHAFMSSLSKAQLDLLRAAARGGLALARPKSLADVKMLIGVGLLVYDDAGWLHPTTTGMRYLRASVGT